MSRIGPVPAGLERLVITDSLWLKNFGKIALCRTVFEIQAYFLFCNFGEKFENSKWPLFLIGQNFFLKLGELLSRVILQIKNFIQNSI